MIPNELKKYIDDVLTNLVVKKSITNGTRAQGSETGSNSLVSGSNNAAQSPNSLAVGSNNEVSKNANSAIALGEGTKAYSDYQLVHGKYNDLDANNIYAHIVGGGKYNEPKNIYTLDWEGNATFEGKVSINKEPTSDKDLVNVDYLNKNIPINFFPFVLTNNNTAKVYVNDLKPYTLYKLKTNQGYDKVMFCVKTDLGDINFLRSDLTMNKYNMLVANKTEEEMTFIVNSVMYKINLRTGRVIKSIDNSFAGPGLGETDLNFAKIDDEITNPNFTWSSLKISEEVENNFNNVELNDGELIFKRNDSVVATVELPEYPVPEVNVTEKDVVRWDNKLDRPKTGKPGQILALTEDGHKWIDPKESSFVINASQVNYKNKDTSINTVQKALDRLLYKKPVITKFDPDKPFGLYQLGDKVLSPITFIWNYTCFSELRSISLSNVESIDATDFEATYTGANITNNTTFTLTLVDKEGGSTSLSKSYTFGNNKYYGASAVPSFYDEEFIKTLNKKLDTRRNDAITFNANKNEYIYICIPCSWGTPIFSSGGFDGGFEEVQKLDLANDYGYVEPYSIWKSDNHSLGNTTINIR